MKEYIWMMIVGFIGGCLYVLREFDAHEIKNKRHLIRRVFYGVTSSMFITYVAWEILIFQGLPVSVSTAIGGGLGYIGAETASRVVVRFFEKKIGVDDEK